MQVNAKVDYALRALAELANADPGPMKAEQIARAQGIPPKFLENILLELRHAGIVLSQRGAEGGYRLGRPPAEITLADVIRVVDGPLANVRGLRPESGSNTPAPPSPSSRSGSPSAPTCAPSWNASPWKTSAAASSRRRSSRWRRLPIHAAGAVAISYRLSAISYQS